MPDGSSSAAPVMRPGPSAEKKRASNVRRRVLLQRQKGNPTDLLHVSGKSIVGFIHGQKVFAGSNGPLLRTRGIFPYRSRGD